jgi:pimeloyl-ACP methyl ester carboxylesterase
VSGPRAPIEVTAPDGAVLPVLLVGAGEPVIVVAHGLGASPGEARLPVSGVRGTKVFPVARAHPGAPPPGPGRGYAELAGDLRAVADATGATLAVGTSLGAATLLHLLAETPDRFARLVLLLPAALDRPRRARLSEGWRPSPEQLAAGIDGVVRLVARSAPLADLAVLARVRVPELVIAERDDPVHTVAVARRLARALPRGRLEVFDAGELFGRDRARLRAVVSSFLAADGDE